MSAPSTHRQRDYRERSRHQLRFVQTEVRVYGVSYLTRNGLLAAEAQGDREAVLDAFHILLDKTLQGAT